MEIGQGVLEASLQRVGRDGHGGVDVVVFHEQNRSVKAGTGSKANGVNQNVRFFPRMVSGERREEFLCRAV